MVRLVFSYIAGLYDGDGSFSIDLHKHPTIPSGFQIQPSVVLSLSERDSAVFKDVMDSFPHLHFTLKKAQKGNVQLRLRNLGDVSSFLKIVRPYLRVFSNVKRAEIVEEIVDFILSKQHGRHYGSDAYFDVLIKRVAELRRYSKRRLGIKAHNINALLDETFEGKNIKALIKESESYTPLEFDMEYLAGLFDAEGYVGIYRTRCAKCRFGSYLRPIMNLNLAIYDAGVLFILKEKFRKFNPQVKIRESNNTAYFQINNLSGVAEFINAIYPYVALSSTKAKIDLVLKAVSLMKNRLHWEKSGWDELLNITESLKKYSKRRRHLS